MATTPVHASRLLTATIANGQTVSSAVDGRAYGSFQLVMPAAFTGTSLTFQVSHDNSTFQVLRDATNQPVTLAVTTAVSYALPSSLAGSRWFKIVSGSAEGAARTLTLIAKANVAGGLIAIGDGGGSVTVDNGGTFAVQDSQVLTDNLAFVDGTSKVFTAGFIYDEVAGTALTENDVAAARVNANRAQVLAIEDGVTRTRYATVTAANALKTDGSAVTQPTSDTQTIVDNAGFTDGTSKVLMAGYVFDEVAGTALTENDAAAGRINANRAQVAVLEDDTTRGRRATIKAASTAAAAADTALVVAISPNNLTQSFPFFIRPRRLSTFYAVFRLAARPYALSNVFAAAGRKQYATLYHTSAGSKIVRLVSCQVALESASAAAIVVAELVRLTTTTAPATGNPAITAQPGAPADTAEATTLALPTTAGSEGNLAAMAEWNLGITGAASTANPPEALRWVELIAPPYLMELTELTCRVGNNEGYAVTVDCSAASTVKGFCRMTWTEE